MSGVQHLLGKLIDRPQERDAIHIAVAPVTATEKLYPGQGIIFSGDSNEKVMAADTHVPIGLVDPYLKGPVFPDQQFWMFLMPGSVTVVRHEWVHPAFRERPNAVGSDRWLCDFAESIGITYGHLIDATKDYLSTGRYLVGGAEMEGVQVPDEFWPHFENVTGINVNADNRGNFFGCSC